MGSFASERGACSLKKVSQNIRTQPSWEHLEFERRRASRMLFPDEGAEAGAGGSTGMCGTPALCQAFRIISAYAVASQR